MVKRQSAKPRRASTAAKVRAMADREWRAALCNLESRYRSQLGDYRMIYANLKESYDRLSDRCRILEDRLKHPLKEIGRSIARALPVARRKGEY